MAWPNFSLTDLYTALITNLNSRLQESGKLFNGVTTTGAEFTDQVKYNSSTKKLETWNGSAWVALDLSNTSVAAASIVSGTITSNLTGNVTGNVSGSSGSCTGNAATATTAANVTKAVIDPLGIAATSATTATNASGTGSIPYARYENGLRIVRGRIDLAGNVLVGSGFTCNRSSTGFYTVTFTNAFSSTAVCVGSSESQSTIIAVTPGTTTCSFTSTTSTTGAAVNNPFEFIAIGPN